MKFNRSPSIKTFKELYSVFGRRRHVVTFASLIPELPNELFSCRYCSWNLLCFLFHELGESRFSIFIKEGNENTKYRKSSKETRGSYSFSEGANAGLIRILPNFCIFAYWFLSLLRVLFEGGSLSRIYGMYLFQSSLSFFFISLLSTFWKFKLKYVFAYV